MIISRSHAVRILPLAAGLLLLVGCGEPLLSVDAVWSAYDDGVEYGVLRIEYPHNDTLFPPDIVAPTFRWKDDQVGVDTWLIRLAFDDGGEATAALTSEQTWRPSEEEWESIKQRSLDSPAAVVVVGVNKTTPRQILSAATISISTSPDEVGAPIMYREVNLPFIDAVKDPSTIRWRFGPISSPEAPPIVLSNLPVCGNCHSFSADGRMLGMDVDYANDKGSYAFTSIKEEIVLSPSEIITWADYMREDGEATFGLLSQVSPDGKYAISTVKDRSVFVPRDELAYSQLFFPIRGILAWYSSETGEFRELRGADDPNYVQSNANWSPDGQTVLFARSKAYRLRRDEGSVLLTKAECEEFLRDGREFIFDLYRVPFNDGAGGEAEPLPGASNNGASNYFPRYSPDGKWIVFCKSKSYMLLQPDSKLYIMPAAGGTPRRMECNTDRMNSWHSWSPNSKWLVFSSKVNTPYTQLLLTHIDEQGHSSPPVLLERFTAADRAANIPEFVNTAPDALARIREAFLDDLSFIRAGDAFLRADDPAGAIQEYKKALKLNPKNAVAQCNLGGVLAAEGHLIEAMMHLGRAIELDPQSHSAHYNLARMLYRQGNLDAAIMHYQRTVEIKPDLADAHNTLGALLCAKGLFDQGRVHLEQAVRLDPKNASACYALGELFVQQDQLEKALPLLREAVRLTPRDATARYCLGNALVRKGEYESAIEHLGIAIQLEPTYASAHRGLGLALCLLDRCDQGARHLALAVRRQPNNPEILRDFAWGLARNGEFPDAVLAARQALGIAEAHKLGDLAAELRKQIELYESDRIDDEPRTP